MAQSTYKATVKGKACSETANQQVDCNYTIGKEFWLSIAGVGQSDAAVTFMKADFDGQYYGTFGVLHGCVIVKPGAASKATPIDLAFVSPRNGKVYMSWQQCQASQ
jgi:hypothetical protein